MPLKYIDTHSKTDWKRLRWSRGKVLPLSTQVRGFKPGRSLQGEKILSTPSFGGEVKPSVLRRRFAAFKRSLNVGKITGQHFRPQFHISYGRGGSWRRKWERLKSRGDKGRTISL